MSLDLYIYSLSFSFDIATEHLLGFGILPEHLNDDKIGRVMDKLYGQGLTNIFLLIALAAVKKYGISTKYSHLDATSFSLHGKYEINRPEVEEVRDGQSSASSEEAAEAKPIQITYGYSRDKRPDLKQFILDLIVSGDADIPLFLKTADGNAHEVRRSLADKAVFGQICIDFKKQVNFESIMVADSALYTQNNLLLIKDLNWITRVALSIKAAQDLVTRTREKELIDSEENPGYAWSVTQSNYGGIAQRWLVIESEKRKESDLKKIEKKLKKKQEEAQQLLARMGREKFESAAAAKAILKLEFRLISDRQLKKENLVRDA